MDLRIAMADRAANEKDTVRDSKQAKKPYTAPVLQRWGTFSDLTRQNNHSSSKDHGNQKGTQ